jgi:hypothetical protein
MHTNGATKSKIINKKTNKKFLKGADIAEKSKMAKYEDHYQQVLVKDVIALIMEAGGALGLSLLAEIKRWFAVQGINKVKLGKLVNWMLRRLSFHQANFLDKMHIEAFKSIKYYETQIHAELPPALVVPNVDESTYPRFSQGIAIQDEAEEDDVPIEVPVEVPIPVDGVIQIEEQDQDQEDDIEQQQRTNRLINMLRAPLPATSIPSTLPIHPPLYSSSTNQPRVQQRRTNDLNQRLDGLNQRLESITPSRIGFRIPTLSSSSSSIAAPAIQSSHLNGQSSSSSSSSSSTQRLDGLNHRLESITPSRLGNQIPRLSSSSSLSIAAPAVQSSHLNGQSSSSSSSSAVVPVPPVELDQPTNPSYSAVEDAEVDAIITNGLANNQAH